MELVCAQERPSLGIFELTELEIGEIRGEFEFLTKLLA